GIALAIQNGILRLAREALPGSTCTLLCALINRFTQCLFDRMYQVASTGPERFCPTSKARGERIQAAILPPLESGENSTHNRSFSIT
ncbi:MAG TPA: hypothetical protein VE843_00665, partial [Ktedonobacteraceae bacterium]|nr:hypothetical protein [Ktedonobacteraceae bacterium]